MPSTRVDSIQAHRLLRAATLALLLVPSVAAAQMEAARNFVEWLEEPGVKTREWMEARGRDLAQMGARALGQDERAAEALADAAEHRLTIQRDVMKEVMDGMDEVSSPSGGQGWSGDILDRLHQDKSPEMMRDVVNRFIPDGLRDAVEEIEGTAQRVSGAIEGLREGAQRLGDAASTAADRIRSHFSDGFSFGLEPGSQQAEAVSRSLGDDASPRSGDLASLIGGGAGRAVGTLLQSNSAAMDAIAETEAAPEDDRAPERVAGVPAQAGDESEQLQSGNAGPERVATTVTTRCGDGRYVTYTVTEDPKYWTTDPKTRFDPCAVESDDSSRRDASASAGGASGIDLLRNATGGCRECPRTAQTDQALEPRGVSALQGYAPASPAVTKDGLDEMAAALNGLLSHPKLNQPRADRLGQPAGPNGRQGPQKQKKAGNGLCWDPNAKSYEDAKKCPPKKP